MAKVLKVCNGCLPRNQVPALMGLRAKVKYCTKCHQVSCWSEMEADAVVAFRDRQAKTEALIQWLVGETA